MVSEQALTEVDRVHQKTQKTQSGLQVFKKTENPSCVLLKNLKIGTYQNKNTHTPRNRALKDHLPNRFWPGKNPLTHTHAPPEAPQLSITRTRTGAWEGSVCFRRNSFGTSCSSLHSASIRGTSS